MNTRNALYLPRIAVLLTALMLPVAMTGCIALQSSSTDEDDGPRDIRWFTNELMEEGVIVRERGPAAFELRARETSRMVLDGLDLIDVYFFDSEETASQQGFELANSYSTATVYRREALVVIRYTDRAKGLSQALRSIMGNRI